MRSAPKANSPSTRLARAQTVTALREHVSAWRAAGQRVALVPTMGNLHAGHLSLVEQARERAARVIVSIFVNPTQFGATEDITRYPRTPHEDEALLVAQGATDLLFMPDDREIYPRGTTDIATVRLPALAHDLCGRYRPGHFDGVASVVLRLLNIVQPDLLILGRKDYQQLILVARMIEDLHVAVELVAGETRREADGLAMSSRNQYLTAEQRAVAPRLQAALRTLAEALRAGGKSFAAERQDALEQLTRAGFRPDYLELRDARDLSSAAADEASRPRVLLAAAWLGRARLIDNIAI